MCHGGSFAYMGSLIFASFMRTWIMREGLDHPEIEFNSITIPLVSLTHTSIKTDLSRNKNIIIITWLKLSISQCYYELFLVCFHDRCAILLLYCLRILIDTFKKATLRITLHILFIYFILPSFSFSLTLIHLRTRRPKRCLFFQSYSIINNIK